MFGEIEGTGFEVIDPIFSDCLIGYARVERLWSGARWSAGPAHICKHSVYEDGALSGGNVLAECTNGLFDGFRVDRDGRPLRMACTACRKTARLSARL